MFLPQIIVASAVILCSLSAVAATDFQRMEEALLSSRSDVHELGPADDTSIHEVCFAIKQLNTDKLAKIVEDISFPKSGKHWFQYCPIPNVGEPSCDYWIRLVVETVSGFISSFTFSFFFSFI